MIIPVKCFTCGKVLADKYQFYLTETRKLKNKAKIPLDDVQYLTEDNIEKTAEGQVLDMLQLNQICCRRHMLTHVDVE
tara:strand:- start:4 stop:237 length:234 start_codon:yes stop_codon:yes gene_type:complete